MIILIAAQILSRLFALRTTKFCQQIPIGSATRGLIFNVDPRKEISFFEFAAASRPLSVLKTSKASGEHTRFFEILSPEASGGSGAVSFFSLRSIPKTWVTINLSRGLNHLQRAALCGASLAAVAPSVFSEDLSRAMTSDSRISSILSEYCA